MVRNASAEQLLSVSPLTPAWRVRDVLGHLCGVSEDIVAGNFPGRDLNAWAAAQVERVHDVGIEEILQRWTSTGIEENFSEAFGQMLFDQVSHEFDIRYALNVRGETTSERVRLASRFAANLLRGPRRTTIYAGNDVYEFDGDEPALTLTCTPFALLRSTTGRRSWDQVCALEWHGDLAYVKAQLFGAGFFSPTSFDVKES